MKNLGQRIKMIRQGIARAKFSERFGISPVTLKRYEDGLREVDPVFLEKLISDQNLCRDWLLYGTGPMYKTDSSQNLDHDQGFMPIKEAQHANFTENTNQKNLDHDQGSFDVDFFARYIKLAEEHAATVRENAELRVQAERHLSRIRDLERENAEIPVLKARIAELERELSERPKLPKTVPVDVSDKSKPTPAHGTGADKTVVPGTGAGISGVGNLGAVVKNGE